jgi:hypothetical protein
MRGNRSGEIFEDLSVRCFKAKLMPLTEAKEKRMLLILVLERNLNAAIKVAIGNR